MFPKKSQICEASNFLRSNHIYIWRRAICLRCIFVNKGLKTDDGPQKHAGNMRGASWGHVWNMRGAWEEHALNMRGTWGDMLGASRGDVGNMRGAWGEHAAIRQSGLIYTVRENFNTGATYVTVGSCMFDIYHMAARRL